MECAGSGLFVGLAVWQEEAYRKLQGSYPVISLSFSNIRETSYEETKKKICKIIQLLYRRYCFLLEGSLLSESEMEEFRRVSADMPDYEASLSLQQLSAYLYRYYGKKVVTTTSEEYADCFGFTETEVKNVLKDFEALIRGEEIEVVLDEQMVYDQLFVKESTIWSLLLATGYLKVKGTRFAEQTGRCYCRLALTNKEVRIMFGDMIHGWFSDYDSGYNDFIKALLQDDVRAMNVYMNRVAQATFSFFDSGNRMTSCQENTEGKDTKIWFCLPVEGNLDWEIKCGIAER